MFERFASDQIVAYLIILIELNFVTNKEFKSSNHACSISIYIKSLLSRDFQQENALLHHILTSKSSGFFLFYVNLTHLEQNLCVLFKGFAINSLLRYMNSKLDFLSFFFQHLKHKNRFILCYTFCHFSHYCLIMNLLFIFL